MYIKKLKGFRTIENVLTSHGIEWALRHENVADFKRTNQNVRTFYFRVKSVNQVFVFLTSVTPDGLADMLRNQAFGKRRQNT